MSKKLAFQVRLEDVLVEALEQAGEARFGGTRLSRNRLIEIAVREMIERQEKSALKNTQN